MSSRLLLILSVLALATLFCSLPGNTATQPAPDLESAVRATLTAIAAQADVQTPAPAAGSIAGSLGYPSNFIPPLRVVAYRTDSPDYYYVETILDQSTYQIDNLPPGTYRVMAYVNDPRGQFPPGFAAGYTAAVVCGLLEACADHTPLDVVVRAGETTTNIDPKDWDYTGALYPPDPLAPQPTTGGIQGTLIFPSSFIPAQRVVAINTLTGQYFYVDTQDGQQAFLIENLPPGNYFVLAYTLSTPYSAAGYSAAVPCGLAYGCDDHTLLQVAVTAGQVTSGINPHDWYAPEGAFPPDPSRP